MSTYFDSVQTAEGEVRVLTKTRWWGIFPKPHTTLMPSAFGELGRLGVVVFWSTSDPTLLRQCHDSLVQSVREFGLVQIREAKNVAEVEPLTAFAMFCQILRPPAPQYVRRIW